MPMNMNCAVHIAVARACINIFRQSKVGIKTYVFRYEVVTTAAGFH